jgi:hypothetical protein
MQPANRQVKVDESIKFVPVKVQLIRTGQYGA